MGDHMHNKRIILLALLAVVLVLAFANAALAYPLVNVPATHQQATVNVIGNRPRLQAAVLSVFPSFYVQGGWGGQAWPLPNPHIDVGTGYLTGKAFTHQVAHEWCHEVQLACDAPGGYGSLYAAWHTYMATTWPQVDTSRWSDFPPLHTNLWNETLMESMRELWRPYYANAPEYRVYATRAQMIAILQSCGVSP